MNKPGRLINVTETIFFFVLIVVLPVVDTPLFAKLQKYTSSQRRLLAYRLMTLSIGSFAAIGTYIHDTQVLLRPPQPPFSSPWVSYTVVGFTIAAAIGSSLFAWRCSTNASARAGMRDQLSSMRFLLPVTGEERMGWLLLSLIGGPCEEILYRALTPDFFHGLTGSHTAALLLSSAAFGFFHLYQGAAGILRGTAVGLFFGLVLAYTQSLPAVMLLHALMNAQMLALYRPEIDAPQEAEKLVRGCRP
jgi:uncharacterized protein